jgi:trigger factor
MAVLMPDAERQTKVTLALQELVRQEGLLVEEEEIATELERLLLDYEEDQRANVAQVLQSQLRGSVASSVLDRKLRERMLAIATGEAPPLETPGSPALADAAPAVTE